MICLNARFTGQNLTGVQRVAYELGRRLLALHSDMVAVAPVAPRGEYAIAVETHPSPHPALGGHFWEQTVLRRLVGQSRLLVGLGGTGPLRLGRQLVMIHDVNYLLGPGGYSARFRHGYRLLQGSLARTARICTVSQWSARAIADAFGMEESAIAVIPNAADHILETPPDESATRRFGLDDRPYALCVGSANPNKNFATVLAAFAGIENPAFDLVIMGGTDPRIFAAMPPLTDHPGVHRLPRVSDPELRAIIAGASVFLMPSLLEGFGLPAIEAMALGTPVIAAKAAALPEVCADAALYVDPRDAKGMAQAMVTMVDRPDLATGFAGRGRRRAADFSWDRSARQLATVIEDCITAAG